MKVLVTGGAGYIGSHAVYELLNDGHEVTILDNLSTGKEFLIDKRAKFVKTDIRNYDDVKETLVKNDIEIVMNFAAKLVVPESVEQPLEYFDTNVNGVSTILRAMKDTGVKKIVFSSTAAVYGEPTITRPIEETDCTLPINPYGSSKLAAEYLIQGAAKAYDMEYVIFRYFNVAGGHKDGHLGLSASNITHLIPVVVETAYGIREQMSVFGTDYDTKDGTCVRDYIHVTDLARAHIDGMNYLANGGNSEIFNLGSASGFTVKEIIDSVEKVSEKSVNHILGDRRPGDPAALTADNKKAVNILNWKINHTLEEMIQTDIDWRNKLNNK